VLSFARPTWRQGSSQSKPAGRIHYPYCRVGRAATRLHAAARDRRRTAPPEMRHAVSPEAPQLRDTALRRGASDRRHSYSARVFSRLSHALARLESQTTVFVETFKAVAVSSTERPPKNFISTKTRKYFVHQGGCLQRVSGTLAPHIGSGGAVQLLVQHRQPPIESLFVLAGPGPRERGLVLSGLRSHIAGCAVLLMITKKFD
jgi:hypothetical protein